MNRIRRARWAMGWAVLAAAVALDAAPRQLNMARLLDRYGGGDVEAVARIAVEAEASEPGSVMGELVTGGQRWIDRAQTWEASRARRLIAAAFALEAAGTPTWVAASFDAGPPTARTLPRFDTRGIGFAANERRALLTWSIRQFLDLRSRNQEIKPAVAEGQPAHPLDEGERQWFLAAVALLTGANDILFLSGQSDRPLPPSARRNEASSGSLEPYGSVLHIARRRFPDEPRFKLAEVFCDERRTTIIGRANVIAIQTQTPEDGVIPPRLLEKRPNPQGLTAARPIGDGGMIPTALELIDGVGAGYEMLTAEPALRAEAWLRLGYHRIRVGDRVRAIDAFGQVLEAGGDDDDLRYLAHFFRGWTLHRLDRRDEAERDYEAALRLRAQSRQVRALLAAVIADRGDRREAREVLGEFLSRPLPATDPWFVFHRGDYRYWPERVVAMRQALRAPSGVEGLAPSRVEAR